MIELPSMPARIARLKSCCGSAASAACAVRGLKQFLHLSCARLKACARASGPETMWLIVLVFVLTWLWGIGAEATRCATRGAS